MAKKYIYENTLIEKVSTDFADFYQECKNQPLELEDPSPIIKSKIPFNSWQWILGFLKYSYKKLGSETIINLYLKDDGTIVQWVPPQITSGMTVKIDEESELWRERKKLPPIHIGSVHHHCSSRAFSSGTDEEDEVSEGIHITIGHMNSTKHSSHTRIVLKNTVFESTLAQVVEPSNLLADWPEKDEIHNQAIHQVCLSRLQKTREYQRILDKKVVKEKFSPKNLKLPLFGRGWDPEDPRWDTKPIDWGPGIIDSSGSQPTTEGPKHEFR